MSLTCLFHCSTGSHCILFVFVYMWVDLHLYLAGSQLLLVPTRAGPPCVALAWLSDCTMLQRESASSPANSCCALMLYKPSGESLPALSCRCLDGGANSKPTQYATWALANLLVDNPAAQVLLLSFSKPIDTHTHLCCMGTWLLKLHL